MQKFCRSLVLYISIVLLDSVPVYIVLAFILYTNVRITKCTCCYLKGIKFLQSILSLSAVLIPIYILHLYSKPDSVFRSMVLRMKNGTNRLYVI